MSTTLKPCPFCQATQEDGDYRLHWDGWGVFCKECGASAKHAPTWKDAITAWNTRALEREAKAEPVAWAYVNPDGECEQIEWGPVFDDPHVTPLYASPPPPAQVRDIPEGWVMVPERIPHRIYNDMLAAQHNTLLKWGRTSFELNLPITAQTASRALDAALTVLYAASPPAPEAP